MSHIDPLHDIENELPDDMDIQEDEPEEMAYSDCCNARATSITPDGSIACTKCHKECDATELPTNNEKDANI